MEVQTSSTLTVDFHSRASLQITLAERAKAQRECILAFSRPLWARDSLN